ncbi:TPA: hypothetical protein ACLLFU_003788 [Providencia stuartii]
MTVLQIAGGLHLVLTVISRLKRLEIIFCRQQLVEIMADDSRVFGKKGKKNPPLTRREHRQNAMFDERGIKLVQ